MDSTAPEDDKDTLIRRACDQCRLRKIRCDKRSPCSNCRSSQVICRSTGAGQKPQETRRRVLISSQYEQKIDLIEERLAGIEEALRDSKNASSTPHTTTAASELNYHVTNAPSSSTPLDHQEPVFEGGSSLAAHSAYASEFLETIVSRGTLQAASPRINEALSNLKQIVNMQDQAQVHSSREVRFPNQKAVPGRLQNLAMPPVQVVLSLLRQIKSESPSVFQGFFPFVSTDRFIAKCREVYFATEDYSDATFIVVNGGLYYVLMEHSFTPNNQINREYSNYLNLCRNNLETALANLNLLISASTESIEALTLGAVYAIEISKPTFAHALISTAARQCQTLGYHRSSTNNKLTRSLFWGVYTLDKILSLRLGRASTLQDYDISIPMIFDADDDAREPWKTMYNIWLKLAKIQGRTYELLYSPAALCQSQEDRVAHAYQLASEMQSTIMEPFKTIQSQYGNTLSLESLYIKSDEVSRLSVLTLIYRAIPPTSPSTSSFISDCIETARAALSAHHICLTIIQESNAIIKRSYIHWTILYAPFVPFIVLFCHVIETSSLTDLSRLTDFVTSLTPFFPLSEAITKLHRLCHILSTVAQLYVEAKRDQQDQTLAEVGQEFDTYLTALGLAPGSGSGEEMAAETATATATSTLTSTLEGGAVGYGQSTQLGNWFSGNQYMMGLLEGDLFEPSWS